MQASVNKISSNLTNVSIVCKWFIWHAPLSLQRFIISPSSTSHHCLINKHFFTLTEGCFEIEQMKDCEVDGSIIAQSSSQLKLACSYILVISKEYMQFLEENLNQTNDECYVTETDDSSLNIPGPSKGNAVWKNLGALDCVAQVSVAR